MFDIVIQRCGLVVKIIVHTVFSIKILYKKNVKKKYIQVR